MEKVDVAVVGGGAAGLAAAVMLSRLASCRIAVLEKGKRVGRKLLSTGNGTCNITNTKAAANRYHGAAPAFAEAVLSAFSPRETQAFFASLGLVCTEKENGRIYPLCEQAGAVLDCLRLELAARGVSERCEAAVTALRPADGGFCLTVGDTPLWAKRVLICTGGAAAPALGGSTDGYGLLTALGHTRTPLFPSLVQVCTDTAYVRAVKGIRVQAQASLCLNGTVQAQETGEVLFTEYGLSGPAVMQISRCAAEWERRKTGQMEAQLDLLPDWDVPMLEKELTRRMTLQERTMEDLLTGLLNKRVGQTVMRVCGIPLTRPAASLTETERAAVAACIKGWRIPVIGTKGFGGAQVTAGGIAADEFDPATLQSRLVPGLYAAGEVLDVDGDCGGFNLQFAWASAHTAAEAIARSLM